MVSRRASLLLAAAAAALALVALTYAPALRGAFVWDDHVLAEADAPFRHVPLGRLFTEAFWPDSPLSDARAPYYRPLVLLSLRLDLARDGTSAAFHATNLAIHLGACSLLAFVALRLGARAEAAIVAALLWGLAPRLSESVAWISGRTDLLAGALGLAALATCPDLPGSRLVRRDRLRTLRSVLTGVFLFGALLGKEVAVAFVAAILVGAWPARGQRVRVASYLGLPVVGWLVLRTVALAGKGVGLRDLGAARRAATVLEAIERYAEMTVDALRPRTSIGILGEVDPVRAALGAVLVLAALAGGVFALRRGRAGAPIAPAARVALTLGAVSLALVVHVVPFTLAGSVAADRLLYVPLAAVALGAASAASRLEARARRVLGGCALVVAGLFAAATEARAADYQDEVRFWVVAAEHADPHNTLALSALGGLARDSDEAALGCRLFERAARILGESERRGLAAHRRARENLAGCWARTGRYEDALALDEELAHEYPDAGRIAMALGFARLQLRDFAGAREDFARATTLEPSLGAFVWPAVAATRQAEAERGRFESAEARAADPLGWAQYLARLGRSAEADAAFAGIAAAPGASAEDRASARTYLALDGALPSAEAATRGVLLPPDLAARLADRRARHARIVAMKTRIEALADEAD